MKQGGKSNAELPKRAFSRRAWEPRRNVSSSHLPSFPSVKNSFLTEANKGKEVIGFFTDVPDFLAWDSTRHAEAEPSKPRLPGRAWEPRKKWGSKPRNALVFGPLLHKFSQLSWSDPGPDGHPACLFIFRRRPSPFHFQ